jgi:hypothetical protein
MFLLFSCDKEDQNFSSLEFLNSQLLSEQKYRPATVGFQLVEKPIESAFIP